jgi:hypothetical protein
MSNHDDDAGAADSGEKQRVWPVRLVCCVLWPASMPSQAWGGGAGSVPSGEGGVHGTMGLGRPWEGNPCTQIREEASMGEVQDNRRAQVSSTGASSSGGEGAREGRRTWGARP